MPKIPRYQSASPEIRVATDPGESAVYGDLATRMERWSNRFAKLGAEKAEREGTQEGAQAGMQEGVPDVPGADTINIKQRAYRDAALMAHQARIQQDIRDTVTQLEAENRMDPEAFDAAVKGYREGMMGEIHQAVRPNVETLFNDYAGKASARINTRLADQSFRNDVQTIENEITSLSEEALSFARDNDEDGLYAAKARLTSLQAQAVKSGLMTEAEAVRQIETLDDNIMLQTAVGEFERVVINDGIDAAEDAYLRFRAQTLEQLDLTPAQRDKIDTRMRGIISAEHARLNRIEAERKAEQKTIEKQLRQEVKDTVYLLEHGRLNDESRARLETLTDLTAGTDLHQDLVVALAEYEAVDKFNRMSVAEQETFLDQLRQGQSDGAITRLADRLETVMEDRRNELENGRGLDLYYEDGYQPAPDMLDFADEDQLRAGLALRNQHAQKAEALYQYDVSPLREGEISMLTAAFEKAPAPDKIRLLGIMADELGGNFIRVMREVDRKGATNLAMAGAVYNTTGSSAARMVLLGADYRRETPDMAPSGAEKTIMRGDLSDTLGTAYISAPRHRAAVEDAIMSAYVGLSAQEGDLSGTYNADRLDQAVTMVTGGIHEWEGSRFGAKASKIPPPVIGWDEDQTQQWIEDDLTPEDIDALGGTAGFASAEFLRLFRREGVLMPMGTVTEPGRPARNQYAVMFNGIPVKRPDGELFILEYQE